MFTAKRVGDPRDYIKGETGDWEIIIGLEVHAQVASTSKLFSGSSTAVSYTHLTLPTIYSV